MGRLFFFPERPKRTNHDNAERCVDCAGDEGVLDFPMDLPVSAPERSKDGRIFISGVGQMCAKHGRRFRSENAKALFGNLDEHDQPM